MNLLSNIPKAFFGFLITSAFIWLLINFSKEYTSEVLYEVKYINLAQNKIFKEAPNNKITLLLKGTGFKLITANFSNKKIELDLEKLQKNKKGTYYFLNKSIKSSIQKQISSSLTLEEIQPDTIFVSLGSLFTKKIPIKHNLNLSFELGYDLAKPIQISPDSIKISGTKEDIININEIQLEPLSIQNISSSVSKEVTLVPFKNPSIKIEDTAVKVLLETDKFTEGEVRIPIELKNVPDNSKVNIFPKKVTLTYKVGLNNFNKINSNSFQVICDYKYAIEENLSFLIPEIKKKPEIVSSIKISPSKIDFLVTN